MIPPLTEIREMAPNKYNFYFNNFSVFGDLEGKSLIKKERFEATILPLLSIFFKYTLKQYIILCTVILQRLH